MRVLQVTERMKEAPAQALRAVFAGIGQVLLVADRLRNRPADGNGAPSAHEPAAGAAPAPAPPPAPATVPAAEATAAAAPVAPSAPVPAAPTAAQPEPAAAAAQPAAAAAQPEPAAQAAATPAAPASVPAAEAAAAAAPAAGDLPVANYDELSIASLRARMRNLDPAQLRALAGYESAHQGRPTVLAMFERRIAKVEGGEA